MVGDAIAALVQFRDRDQSDLEISFRQYLLVLEIEQQAHDVFDRRRTVREDSDLIEEGAILAGIPFVDRFDIVRNTVDFYVADPGHTPTPFEWDWTTFYSIERRIAQPDSGTGDECAYFVLLGALL